MKNALRSGGKWNRLKSLWRDDRTALGALVSIPSVQIMQIIAGSGLDFVFIDMEHGAIDINSLHAMIAATAGSPIVPIVRVGGPEPWQAKLPLDTGALGIVFPMMNTRAAGKAAVRAVRYPPEGERFFGPFYAAPRWGESLLDYTAHANDEVLAIGMIEHIDAVPAINDIVTTPGLDMVIIGPGDLSTSMGFKGQSTRPEVAAAITQLEAPIRDSGVILGGVATDPDLAKQMIDRGYRALLVTFDWLLLQRGIAVAVAGIRAGM